MVIRQIAYDIQKHFADRLNRLVGDTADTCRAVDISWPLIVKLVITVLLVEISEAALAASMTEEEFINLCRFTYRKFRKAKDDREVRSTDQ
jgi:hypothetical protein